jgi:hypothetical protein
MHHNQIRGALAREPTEMLLADPQPALAGRGDLLIGLDAADVAPSSEVQRAFVLREAHPIQHVATGTPQRTAPVEARGAIRVQPGARRARGAVPLDHELLNEADVQGAFLSMRRSAPKSVLRRRFTVHPTTVGEENCDPATDTSETV